MAAPKKKSLAEKKARLIELLARGHGISESVRILGVSRQTYYRWARNDPAFKADAERVLSSPEHRERVLTSAAATQVPTEESWAHTFVRVYRTTGDRETAAKEAGVKPRQVQEALTEGSEEYDEVFAGLMSDVEMVQMWRIEDAALRKAEHDSSMQKFVLSSRLKERYGSQGPMATQQNLFWFNADGESAAMQKMKELFSGDTDRGTELPGADSRPVLEADHRVVDTGSSS
jgi:transposase